MACRVPTEQLFSVSVIFTPLSRPPCRNKENKVRVGQAVGLEHNI